MRSYLTSAFLAAAFLVAPVAAGYAPALSQDFSITNETDRASDWYKQLQAWWDVHAYYPRDASDNKQAGDVKIHMLIHPDGEVWTLKVVQGSGFHSIDDAALYAFHLARLRPVPPVPPAADADVYITVHFVLTPAVAEAAAVSKRPFTVTNGPVHDTVVDTMLAQTCSGTIVPIWWAHRPNVSVQAIFYHKPDGTKWVSFYYNGIGPEDHQVTELGVSAQWNSLPIFQEKGGRMGMVHYAVWPVGDLGDNHLSGTTVDPYGTIDLTCKFEPAWWGK